MAMAMIVKSKTKKALNVHDSLDIACRSASSFNFFTVLSTSLQYSSTMPTCHIAEKIIMSLIFLQLPILYVLLCTAVVGLTVSPDNSNSLGQYTLRKVNSQSFFTSTQETTRIRKRSRNPKKSGSSKNVDRSRLTPKAGRKANQEVLILRKNDTRNPKRLSSRRTINKTEHNNIMRESVRKIKSKTANGIRIKGTRMDLIDKQKRPIGIRREERVKIKRKNNHISSRRDFSIQTKNSISVSGTKNDSTLEETPVNVPCRSTSRNESSLSLRSLFHVPRAHKAPYCPSRKHRITGEQRYEEHEQSSAVPVRSFDRGHTELINEYENERSIDVVGVEYVHPEGHIISSPFPSRGIDVGRSTMRNGGPAKKNATDFNKTTLSSETNVASWNYSSDNVVSAYRKKKRALDSEGNGSSSVPDKYITGKLYYIKKKRGTDYTLIDYRRALSDREQIKQNVSKGPNVESGENIRTDEAIRLPIKNSTSDLSVDFHSNADRNPAETPWPFVPGPISCDLDFQLRPSFVAKLGEFDYVVSVQRQQNPDIPADHACTGVVYNPRFVVIAPHCLHDFCDNYGLTVASTDDLCTIDETIEVDYVIEHESYDPETRKNDIALIKLKSEIHKKAATFSKEDGSLGKLFYAVGFGELMWKSYPTKISKLLQKMPVQRYTHSPHVLKEAAETLYVTSTLDLTGAFRGDFGGALINPQGEFVGLKSKLVKKSTDYEVYTKVQTYLPWVESMVALHGS